MTPSRARAILRRVGTARPADVHTLYFEVFGADFAGSVTVDRARESIREALTEEKTNRAEQGTETMTTANETPSNNVADLMGETTAPAATPPATPPAAEAAPAKKEKAPKAKAEKKEKAPKAKAEKKAKPAKEPKPKKAKQYKDPDIKLRDPDIKRDKDGRITSITGTCTWKEGGKFVCDKTRKIKPQDAFQVRYCNEHKKEAVKLARRNKTAAKAKAKK